MAAKIAEIDFKGVSSNQIWAKLTENDKSIGTGGCLYEIDFVPTPKFLDYIPGIVVYYSRPERGLRTAAKKPGKLI